MVDYLDRLREKLRAGPPYGVAVAYQRSVRANDQDGDAWALAASDGQRVAEVRASLSNTEQAKLPIQHLDAEQLEHTVERLAVRFPVHSRLAELQARELVLTASDLHG